MKNILLIALIASVTGCAGSGYIGYYGEPYFVTPGFQTYYVIDGYGVRHTYYPDHHDHMEHHPISTEPSVTPHNAKPSTPPHGKESVVK